MRKVSDFTEKKIVELIREGVRYCDIAKRFELSVALISIYGRKHFGPVKRRKVNPRYIKERDAVIAGKCHHCAKELHDCFGSLEVEGIVVMQEVHCMHCQRRWRDVYEFVSREEIQ